MRARVYHLLHGDSRASTIIEYIIIFAIVVNITSFILSTVPELSAYQRVFDYIEIGIVSIFTIEYFLRIYTATESPDLSEYSHCQARLYYMLRPYAVIDFLSIFPYWALRAVIGFNNKDVAFLILVRIFRLFRVFKTEKYSKAFTFLSLIIKHNCELLFLTFILESILFLFALTAVYMAFNPVLPEEYSSIPTSLYPTVLMVTSAAIPDQVPTIPTKIVVAIISIFAVLMISLPTGVVSSSFYEVGKKYQKMQKQKEMEQQGLEPGAHTSLLSPEDTLFASESKHGSEIPDAVTVMFEEQKQFMEGQFRGIQAKMDVLSSVVLLVRVQPERVAKLGVLFPDTEQGLQYLHQLATIYNIPITDRPALLHSLSLLTALSPP